MDDIALNLKVVVSLLNKLGVKVAKQAVNGAEAAAAAEAEQFDCIFMGAVVFYTLALALSSHFFAPVCSEKSEHACYRNSHADARLSVRRNA